MTYNWMSGPALAFASAAAWALSASALQAAPKEVGIWYDDSGKGAVKIELCGAKLCGRIYWLKEQLNAEGKPLRDKHNPNESQRMRPICGLQVVGGLAAMDGGEWDSGWIYDPKEGKSYSVAVKLAGPDTLKVTGYLVMKMMGRTLTWTRAPDDLPACGQNNAAATDGAAAGASKAGAAGAAAKPVKAAAPRPEQTAPKAGGGDPGIDSATPSAPRKAAKTAPQTAAKATGDAQPAPNPKPKASSSAGKTATSPAKTSSSKSTTAKAQVQETLPWNPDKKKASATGKTSASEVSKTSAKKPAQDAVAVKPKAVAREPAPASVD